MIPAGSRICESGWMRKGIEVRLGPGDRERLEAVIGSGNSPQKHVWRARIVLLSADGVGTMAIQRHTGKGKPTIWRWQARFMAEGVDGLLHEATRPAGKPPLTAEVIERVVEMTLAEPPGERTHWTGRVMAEGGRDQPPQRAADLGGTWPEAAPGANLQAVERSEVCRQGAGCGRALYRSARACAGAVGRREVADPGARPHPAGIADEEGPLRDDDPRLQAPRHDNIVCRPRCARRQGHRPVYGAPSASGIHPLPQQDQPRDPGRCRAAPDRRQLCDAQASQGPRLARTA